LSIFFRQWMMNTMLFYFGLLGFALATSSRPTNMSIKDAKDVVTRCLRPWKRKVARYQQAMRVRHNLLCKGGDNKTTYDKWIPLWVCEDAQRLPLWITGDGPKWMVGTEAFQSLRTPPLIISLGSNGEIDWELGMRNMFPTAEIHIVDPSGHGTWNNESFRYRLRQSNLTLHEWWAVRSPVPGSQFTAMTVSKMLATLGHPGAVVEYLKVDIEGAEWELFATELRGCRLRFQHLNVELHGINCTAHEDFFHSIDRCGYRVAWAEPNHWGCDGWLCVEYTIISSSVACAEYAHSHGCPPCVEWRDG